MQHRPTADACWWGAVVEPASPSLVQSGQDGVESGRARAERGLVTVAGRRSVAEIQQQFMILQYVIPNCPSRILVLNFLPNCEAAFVLCALVLENLAAVGNHSIK